MHERQHAGPLCDALASSLTRAPRVLRQRRRLGGVLRQLDDEQWASPSRCAEWTVQGVISHLIGTNGFWAFAMKAALDGEPTRFLGTFDPVATPIAMVDGMRELTPAEVLAQYDESVDAMAVIYTGVMMTLLIIALRFVNPTQLVAQVKEEPEP